MLSTIKPIRVLAHSIVAFGTLAVTASVMLFGSACTPSITPEKVNRIKVCKTTHTEIKEMFGRPDRSGQMGGHTTWTYKRNQEVRLLLMFDRDTIVSDLVYNPAGLVELKSRCEGNSPPEVNR